MTTININHLSSTNEVSIFAMKGNHILLWQCIQAHKAGLYTWEQAMQVAAVAQAETIAELTRKLVDCVSRSQP